MKTKILILLITTFSTINLFAQDRTTVTANSSEISDNLDLRAVASIFGDSENLEDFERRLNDPKTQISNLDLNNDNRVDYLRVIETVEGRAHLIVIQSVLGRDAFQDIATVEVEKDRYNRVQVQVVGDVYMYGHNYIYEPVYSYTPVIYTNFWLPRYRPYCSAWYWDYYPSFYIAWNPFPIFTYRNHINLCINNYHIYNYVTVRHCEVAYNNYRGRRANAYEVKYPDRAFIKRNNGYTNRYELDSRRDIKNTNNRSELVRNTNTRNSTRNNSVVMNEPQRDLSSNYESPRNVRNIVKNQNQVYTQPERDNTISYDPPRNVRNTTRSENQVSVQPVRENNTSYESPRNIRNNTRNENQTSSQPIRNYNNTVRNNNSERTNLHSQNRSNSTRSENTLRGNRRG